MRHYCCLLFLGLMCICCSLQARIYLGAQWGYTNAAYNNSYLAAGYKAKSIKTDGLGSYRVFLGYSFNQMVSTDLSVSWFQKPTFKDISNGSGTSISKKNILNNVISLTVHLGMPIINRVYLGTELGIGYVARGLIASSGKTILPEGNYVRPVFGAEARVKITDNWRAVLSYRQTPELANWQLPSTSFYGIGVGYWFN